jgi:uncharacterized membrane protein YfcA
LDGFWILAAVAAAFCIAGFVKGVIGLGLPTVAIGLLGLLMTPAQAAAILIVPSFVTNVWQCFAGGGTADLLRRMWPMLAGIGAGTFIGAVILPHGGGVQGTVWLGVALVAYAALGLFNIHFRVSPQSEWWLGPVMGFFTGAITVATGVFTLPGVPYIQALNFERDKLVQALGLSFTVSTVTLAVALAHAGEMTSSIAWPTLIGLGAALAGMVLGQIVRGRVSAATFRLCFFVGLLMLGLHLALRGLL